MSRSALKINQCGFTLIELMVTIAIGLILIGGGLAAFRGAGAKEELKQAGYSFQINLRSFQQKSLSGEKPVDCLGDLQGFRAESDPDLSSYKVKAECALVDGPETEFELGGEAVFEAEFSDIVFYVLKSGPLGAQTIVLNSSEGDYSYEVIIESTGVIRGGLL
jgi:prepilin-type N-terminal cleavage/methylation domain-containing protein